MSDLAQNTPQTSLLTIEEAALVFNVSSKTLRRWEEQGYISPLRTPGGHRRYSKDQIENFLKQTIKSNQY